MVFKKRSNGSPLFFGVVFVLVFTLVLVRAWYDELNYTKNGTPVTVTVTRVDYVRAHSRKQQNYVYVYGEYTLGGNTYEARVKNADSSFSGMKTEGYVLSGDTELVYVPSGTGKLGRDSVLPVLFIGVGIFLIYRGSGKGKGNRDRLLNERGITTNGYVVDCSCDYDSEPPRYYVTVRYTDEYGADHEFQIVGGKEYSEGEEVTVRYALKAHSEFIAEIVG